MKRFSSFLIFLSFVFSIFSQKQYEIEPAVLECEYNHIQVKDTVNNRVSNDIMILRIGKNRSQFYSYYTLFGQSMTRRELVAALDAAAAKNDFTSLPTARTTEDYIYKDFPDKGKVSVFTKLIIDHFKFEDRYQPQVWSFCDSTKQILGYFCQKAECEFRGRKWTAWFTPEIPISNGPWLLNGLPGLILEAYDKNKDYFYTIRGVKQSDLTPITFYNPKERTFEKTDRISFLKAKHRAYFQSEPMREIEAATGINLSGGKASPPREKKHNYEFIERDYR